ncbi:GDSL esterase/lipase At3g43550 isoform X2 [Lactuca sativa]|uniref:GDSL esterase/lipase At3g43550 isoform X2 n=1 Tax=Lactuca sativa TaxID=4236 RepID=UPI001C68B52B|nr:GDSL esterase/lipase At3g43550 isoform X2 [Lactuca sativa]
MQVFLLLHRQLSLLLLLPLLLLLQLQCSGMSNDSNQSPCDLGKRCRLNEGTHVVPAVIVFGDSVVDTGNNNNLATVFKVNYPPYGKDFYGGQPTGRFSNGKVPPDLIVEELGIKEVLPPYLGPRLPIEDLRTGVNFASGGGGYDPLTSQLASVISLPGQIELFKEYLEKVKSMAGEEAINDILSKGLFVVATGSNDVTNTYFNNPLRRYHFDFESYSRLLVDSASSFLQDLYNLGVRRIGVFSLPPIGCLPSQRTLVGGIQRECVKNYNELAELFNTMLSMEINSLSQRLPFAKMVYVDAYYLPLDMIQNPAKYGLIRQIQIIHTNFECTDIHVMKILDFCSFFKEKGTIEVAFLCKYTCTNVSEYVFWDSFHFTEDAYRIIVRDFLNKNLKNLIM